MQEIRKVTLVCNILEVTTSHQKDRGQQQGNTKQTLTNYWVSLKHMVDKIHCFS